VPRSSKFFTEIEWMKAVGITTGIRQPNGTYTYAPGDELNRGAMAAFLNRLNRYLHAPE